MNNKGYMTVEASVIVPVILLGVFMTLAGLIIIYEKGTISARETEALYTIPLDSIRDSRVDEYLSSYVYDSMIVLGSGGVSTSYSRNVASCDGRLEYMGEVATSSSRELGVVTDRLRRWQFYDDHI